MSQQGHGTDVVVTDRRGPVAVVTFNRPDKLNAVTREVGDAWAAHMRAADADPEVRAIVVTGAGRGFCAGADLGLLAGGADALHDFVPAVEDLPQMALDLPTPVIAAVNGPAYGVGFAYMLGSDVRFAAQGATMSTTFARLGLVAEYGLSWQLPRLIGMSAAMDLLLTGRAIDADEAARIGLVQAVLPPDDLVEHAVGYAGELARACSPYSLANIKAQVYADTARDRATALADTLHRMQDSMTQPDLAEAMRARAEQRAPQFPARRSRSDEGFVEPGSATLDPLPRDGGQRGS